MGNCSTKKWSKNKDLICCLVAFLVSFVPRLFLSLNAYPLRTLSDETATISSAAFAAGLDWSNVISSAGYYGGGYTIFFAPLFYFFSNPVAIYRAMLSANGILQAATAIIAYYCMRKYAKIENRFFCVLASVVSSYFVVTRNTVVYNEQMLIFLSWLIFLVFLRLASSKTNKEKVINTGIMMMLLSYSLTLHTRAVIYWAAFGIIVILHRIFYKKWLVSIPCCLLFCFIGILASNQFIDFMQSNIWLAGEGESLRNSSISDMASGKLQLLLDPTNWQAWLDIVLGQLNTINVASGGLFVFLSAAIVITIAKMQKPDQHPKEDLPFLCAGLMFILAIIITIAGQSLTWLSGASTAIKEGFETQDYGLKSFVYVRYFGPYIGPVFLTGICLIYKYGLFKIYKKMLLPTLLLGLYWVICIAPYLKNLNNINRILEVYWCFGGGDPKATVSMLTLIMGNIIGIIIYLVAGLCIKKKKAIFPLVLLGTLFLYQYIYNAWNNDIYLQKSQFESVDAGYSFIKDLECKMEVPDTFYVEDVRDISDHQKYYLYQFMLNHYKILPGEPPEEIDEAIVFSNAKVNSAEFLNWIAKGYSAIVLNDKETVFAKGEELKNQLVQAGYILSDLAVEWTSLLPVDKETHMSRPVSSTGKQEYLLCKTNIEAKMGTLTIDLTMTIDEYSDDIIARVLVWQTDTSDIIINRYLIADMISENKITLELSGQTDDSTLGIALISCDGCYFTLEECAYARTSISYAIGADHPNEIGVITEMINELDAKSSLTYLVKDGVPTQSLSTSFLENQLNNCAIEVLSESKFNNQDNEQPVFIIMHSDENLIWKLLEKYTILDRTQSYTLLMRTDRPELKDYIEHGGTVYSNGKKLSGKYFELQKNGLYKYTAGFCLPSGEYIITAKTEGRDAAEWIGKFFIRSERLQEINVNYDKVNREEWHAQINISIPENEYITYGNYFISNFSGTNFSMFVERVSDYITPEEEV